MKYLGSKARIANDILPIMLIGMKAGDTFVDAFCEALCKKLNQKEQAV